MVDKLMKPREHFSTTEVLKKKKLKLKKKNWKKDAQVLMKVDDLWHVGRKFRLE